MGARPQLWVRHEVRSTERRTPVVPDDARSLIEAGFAVTVEESPQRVFPAAEYAAVGCSLAPAGSWVDAPEDAVVIGLKELPDAPGELRHRHVYFGHAYKGQHDAPALLRRFAAGGGELLDIEYLTDATGRRLAAFGYWAGYVGAALALLHLRGTLQTPLHPTTRDELDAQLLSDGDDVAALVIGASGRSGTGARDALAVAGIGATGWDTAETRELDRAALLRHDVLVNTVLTRTPVPPFLTDADLDHPDRRLSTISDVTCDVTSEHNVLPIYDRVTSWDAPALRLRDGDGAPPVDIIAIDNLPSLLPREASLAFSADLTPHLSMLGQDQTDWERTREHFRAAMAAHPG